MKFFLLLLIASLFAILSSAQIGTNTPWTFIQGDSVLPLKAEYGIKGLPSEKNSPGPISEFATWKDKAGNFWLFGGSGIGYRNDLWKYIPATKQWAWMNGEAIVAEGGTYGTKGTPDPKNRPGARIQAISWSDNAGNLWLFGGNGYTENYNGGYLSDLWKYNISTNQWTWVNGDNTNNVVPVHGSRGIASVNNNPGGRETSVSFTDTAGNFWLLGGLIRTQSGYGAGNDLWKYNISSNLWTWVKGDSVLNAKGTYGIKGIAESANTPKAKSDSYGWTDANGKFWLFGGNRDNDLWKYDPAVNKWAWVNGDSTANNPDIYGTQNVSSPQNKPGGRHSAATWIDKAGNMWFYGGSSFNNPVYRTYDKNDLWKYNPTINEWTWVKGDTGRFAKNVYGSKGVPAAQNTPGARTTHGWIDSSGKLWLYGGEGIIAGRNYFLNDMWQFDPAINQWTWTKGDTIRSIPPAKYATRGTEDKANKPGPRNLSATWTDNTGKLWLFGGDPSGGGYDNLNDLWKYNTATGNWTWVNGDSILRPKGRYGVQGVEDPDNKPPGRNAAFSWKDASGKLWLFGGTNKDLIFSRYLNDLWSYDIKSGNWKWVNGDSTRFGSPVYGTQGVPASANMPAPRAGGSNWIDKAGNLWLFGGFDNISRNVTQFYKDLWKYNPVTNEWTWVNGNNTVSNRGVYGVQGIAAPSNKPGGRDFAASWTDSSGNFWLFGGYGYATGFDGFLNDLWKYDVSTNLWTWMKGNDTTNTAGVYGLMGIPASANMPGARWGSNSWTDSYGNLWLFGGGFLNDLWKYNIATNQWVWIKGDSTAKQYGVYGMGDLNKPGARRFSSSWKDAADNFWLYGGNGFAQNGETVLNDLWKLGSNTLIPTTLLNIYAELIQKSVEVKWQTQNERNLDRFIIERSSDGINFTAIGNQPLSQIIATTKSYSFIDLKPMPGKNFYRIVMVDVDKLNIYSKVVEVEIYNKRLQVFPNPANEVIHVRFTPLNEAAVLLISDGIGRKLKTRMIDANASSTTIDIKNFPKGNYLLQLITKEKTESIKFLKQ